MRKHQITLVVVNFSNKSMKSLTVTNLCTLIFSLLLVSSCNDPIEDGLESLQGVWTVTQVVEITSIVNDLGTEETGQVTNDEPEGQFEFIDQTLDYSYTLSDSEVFGSDDFELISFKENSGFTKVRRFELEVGEKVYQTVFDDDTKKSYKDATSMTLIETVNEESTQMKVVLQLEKE